MNREKRKMHEPTHTKRWNLYRLLGILVLCQRVPARSWREIILRHELEPTDPSGLAFLAESDNLVVHTPAPTISPTSTTPETKQTTYVSTASPSPRPTNAPSEPMQKQSTAVPSRMPTTAVPSTMPSTAPTSELQAYPPIQPPLDPYPWYYNYNTRRSSQYGPGYPSLQEIKGEPIMGYNNNAWGEIANPPNQYWEEFTTDKGFGPWKGVMQNRDVLRNMCGRVGMQSPIDVRSSGASCKEHHQIRSRPGDFRLKTTSIMKQILPSKLRLLYQRRNCPDLSNPQCAQPDPPKADFPSGWGAFADVLHVDFKVPSEHVLNGERFDGEMQIVHLNPHVQRLAIQVALIKATNNGHNYYFEQALQAFEARYEADKADCLRSSRRNRNLRSSKVLNATDEENWVDVIQGTGNSTYGARSATTFKRRMQTTPPIGVWDPHHEMLIPSIYFWRYDGSLTEPPCSEFVTWFISDKPMKISKDQLARMKHVLFTHVDRDCGLTSVHFDESVARPIQSTAGRPVWHCTKNDFAPDTGIILE